jgi:hypothetical protein
MTMKRDCLFLIGGLAPVVLVWLLPQRFWLGALLALILVAALISALIIPRLGEMERQREERMLTHVPRIQGTPAAFWVARQSFRDQ